MQPGVVCPRCGQCNRGVQWTGWPMCGVTEVCRDRGAAGGRGAGLTRIHLLELASCEYAFLGWVGFGSQWAVHVCRGCTTRHHRNIGARVPRGTRPPAPAWGGVGGSTGCRGCTAAGSTVCRGSSTRHHRNVGALALRSRSTRCTHMAHCARTRFGGPGPGTDNRSVRGARHGSRYPAFTFAQPLAGGDHRPGCTGSALQTGFG